MTLITGEVEQIAKGLHDVHREQYPVEPLADELLRRLTKKERGSIDRAIEKIKAARYEFKSFSNFYIRIIYKLIM